VTGSPHIGLDGVGARLGGREALSEVTLEARGGALIALVGPNGAGKSTLLRAMAGLAPYSGRIAVDGEDLATMDADARARRISFLPQGRAAHWPMSVERVVALGRLPHGAQGPAMSARDEEAVARAMAAADVTGLRERRIDQLSGGERARALLARALAGEAPILLADEPMEALDPAHRIAIMETLEAEAARGALVIAAMHDLSLAAQFSSRAIVLHRGRLDAYGPTAEILNLERIARVYGVAPQAGTDSPFGPRWVAARSV
jgi:iron complex transport system ATP-binding protein